MSLRAVAVIPARLAARRFPGKVLHSLHDQPLLWHVWSQLVNCGFDDTIIATPDAEVEAAATAFGAHVHRTDDHHPTGSDRVWAAVESRAAELIVNVQADTLGLDSATMRELLERMEDDPSIDCGTLVTPITDTDELVNPHCVKAVLAADSRALWFSRALIPHLRGVDMAEWVDQHRFWRHIGVYVYRYDCLRAFSETPRSSLEVAESLEQLRLLEMGCRVIAEKHPATAVSIDRPQDVNKLTLSQSKG